MERDPDRRAKLFASVIRELDRAAWAERRGKTAMVADALRCAWAQWQGYATQGPPRAPNAFQGAIVPRDPFRSAEPGPGWRLSR
jgi:hypothetical protein